MHDCFGVKAKNLQVAVSPSLGYDCAEFINYKEEFPQKLHRYHKDGKMDLKQMAHDELLDLGLYEDNIDVSSLCTYLDPESFYSYRLSKTKKRLASFISLK